MDFSEIIGQKHLQSHLIKTVDNGRVPHAQLFVGNSGSGLLPMAIAYAQYLLCQSHEPNSTAQLHCKQKIAKLAHPDLHFVYPVNTNDVVKKNPVSSLFSEEWRAFVLSNPYASLFDWFQTLGIENKQGNINVREAEEIAKRLSLKAYEGGYKVMIIWMADKMNTECANKILKLVEEPPERTVLLLLTEQEEQILATIRSRCQRLHFPLLPEEQIAKALQAKHAVPEKVAKKVSRQAHGDFNKALHLYQQDGDDKVFEAWFVQWVRTAFKAKGNKAVIHSLLLWSDSIASEGRETQKKFLLFCMELFRQAMLQNYKADSLIFFEAQDSVFSIEKFAPFIHQNNIYEITKALEDAIYHVERNGNAKIIFTDLSMQLTRLIHASEKV
ncbi:DNA polymerase III subunit delta' [Altibacter sp.]|uniref:DNA polymerase III subunit n=1 Tax=Altibacter sp. TaxID=2024823 RepID=UPI000C92A821|nr:DNA polymerase III subunit delta' [Altibacter sp.]MAP55666.1 DNA polymerase III subunit delta' [Altibacter sp.]